MVWSQLSAMARQTKKALACPAHCVGLSRDDDQRGLCRDAGSGRHRVFREVGIDPELRHARLSGSRIRAYPSRRFSAARSARMVVIARLLARSFLSALRSPPDNGAG